MIRTEPDGARSDSLSSSPTNNATVAELVDAQDLGSCGATRGGSSPSGRIAPENNAPPPGVRSWTADAKWRWPDGPAKRQLLRLNHDSWDQTAQDAHREGDGQRRVALRRTPASRPAAGTRTMAQPRP